MPLVACPFKPGKGNDFALLGAEGHNAPCYANWIGNQFHEYSRRSLKDSQGL